MDRTLRAASGRVGRIRPLVVFLPGVRVQCETGATYRLVQQTDVPTSNGACLDVS